MPTVRISRTCTVGGRSFKVGELVVLDEKATADLLSLKVGHVVPSQARTALDPAAYSARRTDRNGA